ncbi:MAG: ACP S-malonyltransferase [Lactobacillus sp.]|jgi:[acyl-carrier-protein] S-malonyltransferase|nr:ACP S-malonyltransferase [Lactobacillus sp.]MCI2034147.1 ACP S-malonyltransferase [Lactobacillus sp.]
MKTAVVFSGQGSEFAGMGRELYHNSLIFKQNIDAANAILAFDLPAYLFGETPLSARPQDLQPALVAFSVALYRAAELQADVLAGLSLGEYSALIAGGQLDLEAGLALVAKRGAAMAAACKQNPGGMLALRLKDPQALAAVMALPDVWLANRNSPKQVVLGGRQAALLTAQQQLRELGIKALPLPVAGAFHTPLMAPAQPALATALAAVAWHPGERPVISTTTQTALTPETSVANLTAQVATATALGETMATLSAQGVTHFVEVGPKPILAKLIHQQLPAATVATVTATTLLGDD